MGKEQMIKQLKSDIERWKEKQDNATTEFELTKATTYLKHYMEELRMIVKHLAILEKQEINKGWPQGPQI